MTKLITAARDNTVRIGNKRMKSLLSTSALAAGLLVMGTGAAHAVDALETPMGENVVGGSATFDRPYQGLLNVNQGSDRVVIDWDSFNIGERATTEFFQPGSGSLAVNRVTGNGADPTQILGTLKANGRVMVLDRDGVLFGHNSVINVGGIIASTGDVDNDAIMGGVDRIEFTNFGSGKIENFGTISVADAGLAAFVSPQIANSGIINAKLGRVAFGAGSKVTLDLYGDNLLEIALDDKHADALIENFGEINAEGGTVLMTAQAAKEAVDNVINMKGVVRVSSVEQRGGKIILKGGNKGTVNVSGTADASGEGGGDINITGENILLADSSQLLADGGQNGDGGNVIVIADNAAIFRGTIFARGGTQSGNGGFVDTSGLGFIRIGGTVDTSAANGWFGTWLIDPTDLVIRLGSGDSANDGVSNTSITQWLASGSNGFGDTISEIFESEIEGQNTNITLRANRNITVADGVGYGGTLGDGTIQLQNNRSLTIETLNNPGNAGGINLTTSAFGSNLLFKTTGTGDITIRSSYGGSQTGNITLSRLESGNGDILIDTDNGMINLRNSITSTGGDVTFDGNASSGGGAVNVTAGDNIDFNGSLNSGGGNVNLNAGDNITLDGAVSTAGGGFSATAGNDVGVNDDITTSGGNVSLSAGSGLGINGAGDSVNAGAGNISVLADSFYLGGTFTANQISIGRNDSNSRISVGGDAGGLWIDNDELGRMTANTLVIGNALGTVDNDVRVSGADADHIGQTIINTRRNDGSGAQDVLFSGTSSFGALTVNADDDIEFANNAVVNTAGAVLFNTDTNNLGDGDFTMGTNSRLRSNGNSITVNTKIASLAAGAAIDSDGAAINLNAKTAVNTTAGSSVISDGGTISITTDAAALGGTVNATNAGIVNIERQTLGQIGLGGGAGGLSLSQSELSNITAGTLNVGNPVEALSKTTDINVTGVNLAHIANVNLYALAASSINYAGINNFANVNAVTDIINVLFGGSVNATGSIFFDAPTVNLNGNLSAPSINGTATTVNVLGSTGGAQINDGVAVAGNGVGAVVNVAAGTYNESVTVSKNSISLRGANYGINPNTGVRGPEAVVTPGFANGFTLSGNNVTVDGFTVLGGIFGFGLSGGTGQTVSNNIVTGTVSGGLAGFNGTNVNVSFNLFDDVNGDGVFLSNVTGATVNANVIDEADGDGVDVGTSSNVNVTSNTISNVEQSGVSFTNVSGGAVSSNTLLGDNAEEGVTLKNSNSIMVSGNLIDDFSTGVDIEGGTTVTVDGNTMTSVEYGVLADTVAKLKVTNNKITGNSILGVHVLNSNGANVSSNVLNEFATGVKVENSDNVNVSLNTITHSTGGTTGILVMGGSDDGDVLSNIVTRYNIGIDGQNGNNIEIANNTVNNSVQHGIRLLNATNSLIGSGVLSGGNIVNGTATGFQQNGIQVSNGTGNRVWFNTVNNAGWDGISVFNSPNVQINDNRVNNSYRSAIALGASNGAQILRNILNNNWGGMWLSGSNIVDVLNNTINTTTGWHGIYVAGTMDDLDIKTNTVDNASQTGIYVQNASNVRIGGVVLADGNTVTGSGADGIYVAGLTGTNRIGYNTVTMSDSGDDDGIDVDNSGSMTINNNTVNNAGDNGIELSGNTAANTITNNAVNFAGWDGINVQNGNAFVDVSGNTVLDTVGASGIAFINHGGDGRIVNNTVRRSGRLGVYVGNASGLEITGNTISDSGQLFGTNGTRWAGIHAEWANNTLIENNTVTVSSGDGINIGGPINGGLVTTTGNIIRGNVVYGTGLDGVSVDSSTGIQVRNNKIGVNAGLAVQGADNIGGEGIDVNNSAGAQITGNHIRETVSNGISINPSPGSLIHDNNIADFGNNANGIYVLASDNTDVFGNTVDGNGTGQTGIRVQNSSGVDVGQGQNGGADRNTVTDVETGVAVIGGSNVTVDNNLLSNVNFGVDALNTLGTFTVVDNDIDAVGSFNNGTTGIRVAGGATVVIGGGEGAWNAGTSDGNRIDEFTNGIIVDGATNLTVDNNDITRGSNGMLVNAVTGNVTIVDNYLEALGASRVAGQTGIQVTNSGTVLIGGAGNGNSVDGYMTGINLANDGATTVTENDITDVSTGIRADDMFTSLWIDNNDIDANNGDVPASGFIGIYVTDSNNVQIGEGGFAGNNGNDVDDFGYGVAVVGGNNVTIDANDITDGNYGVYADTVGSLKIFDNFADGRAGKPGNGTHYGIFVNNSFDAQIGALNDGNSVEDYVVGIRVQNSNSADVKYNDVDETTWNGIEIASSNDVVVDRNTVDDSGWDNINVSDSNNADITNNTLSDATGASGIAVINSDGAYVFNNDIDRSARLGIYVGNGDNIVIDSNEIDDAGIGAGQWAGIHVEGSDNVTVTNNDIDDVDGDGINLGGFINAGLSGDNTGLLIVNGNLIRNVAIDGIYGTANVDEVRNNTIYRTGDDGIEIKNSPDVQVTGNKVGLTTGGGFVAYNNIGGEGIRVTGSNGADILNNQVSDTVSHGIYLNPSHDAVIAGNDISGAGIDGIHVSGSDRVRIEDNDIFARTSAFNIGPHSDGAARDGIHVTGGEDAYILNNRVTGKFQLFGTSHEGAGRDGIRVESNDGVRIHSNNVSGQSVLFLGGVDGAGRDGISVLNSDDADIRSNTVFRTGDDGIQVEGGNDAYVAFNDITRAGDDGIYIVNSFSAELFDNTVSASDEDGIHIENSDEAFVDLNEVYGGLTGIRVQNSDDVVVEDNYVADQNGFWFLGIGDGIFALNTDNLVVSGNTVDNANNDGIDVQDSTNADVFGNTVTDSGEHGIRLNGGSDNTVEDNDVTDSAVNGIRVDGGTNASVLGNRVDDTGDDGISVWFSNGATVDGNRTTDTSGDGIQVVGSNNVLVNANDIDDANDDGIDIEGGSFVTVSGNWVDEVNNNGIETDNSDNVTVSGNFVGTVTSIGGNGIDVRNANVADILGNTVGTFVMGHGIFVDPSFDVTIDGNIITGAGLDGIHVEDTIGLIVSDNIVTDSGEDGVEFDTVDNAELLNNVITNSGANGFFVSGPNNGLVALAGNVFNTLPGNIGALFESGDIDLTGGANTFNDGAVGMRFAPYAFKKGGFAPMSLVDDTIGTTIFNGQTRFYVQLDNEAFFAPGFPTILNGLDATYDGVNPSSTGGILTQAQFDEIESKIFHFTDRNDLGLFFFGFVPDFDIAEEDIFRDILGFDPAGGGLRFTITGLPLIPGAGGGPVNAFTLAGIEPAAGGEEGENAQNAGDLADIEPAAGGTGAGTGTEDASCWSDAVTQAIGGATVSYAFSGEADDALADATNCETGTF